MYIVEGNIGAGKSTLLHILKNYFPNVNVVQEPVERWNALASGKSLLENFYLDPKRWAFSMESYALMCRVLDWQNLLTTDTKSQIGERSVYSGYYCFAKNGFGAGFLSKAEWEVYTQLFEFFVKNKCFIPSGFIYLRTSPEVVFERIKKRARLSESSISLDYLRAIHDKHEDFLMKKINLLSNLADVKVIVLDGNLDFENDRIIQDYFVSCINSFISDYDYSNSASVKLLDL